MLEKLKKDPKMKDLAIKIIAVLIILSIALLSFDVFTQNKDGRKQIIDDDGGTEAQLCSILTDIKGVGDVDVMLQYNEKDQISGVIVTAQGADDPIVRNNLVNAVRAVFNIPVSSVMVFEKDSTTKKDGGNQS
ncbi:hypothetical protein NE619_04035 [Anaerovorax odorimutans]|uniref:Stage III sporulation protein AG n=1 Tax=Anaerovorax odorimutans TaxID=109327 RepID=A0ABT1RL45_9FIRM|nr:hypothetical protein [Anaerovorax odorimutans]MCQ4635888.1 hypothetical protein [Anaerovorax odorimutans]